MGKANLPRLIQNWSRFIMQQVHGVSDAKSLQTLGKHNGISRDIYGIDGISGDIEGI